MDNYAHSGSGKPLRLIGYIRVSTEEQAAGGLSLEAQEHRISGWCAALGYELGGVEVDVASGGLKPGRRPGLAALLARVRDGAADGVIVARLDRLSRSTLDVLELADRAKRECWQLLSVQERLDTTDAGGQFVLTMLAALAQMERQLIGERTMAAMARIAAQGRARSYRLPFGYRVEGKPNSTTLDKGDRGRLVPHAAEQRVVSRIERLRTSGLGAHAIATRLNRAGTKNPRTERPWSVSSLRGVIATLDRRRRLAVPLSSKRASLLAQRREPNPPG